MRRFLLACLGCAVAMAGGGSVAVKSSTFLAEVAVTEREQARGLMYRQSLAKDRCMVFVGEGEALRPMRTRNHLMALDLAWVDADGRVVERSEHTPPCKAGRDGDCPSYGGSLPARHVLAFPSGTFRRLGLKLGDRVGWELQLDDGRMVRGGAPLGRAKRKR